MWRIWTHSEGTRLSRNANEALVERGMCGKDAACDQAVKREGVSKLIKVVTDVTTRLSHTIGSYPPRAKGAHRTLSIIIYVRNKPETRK